MIIKWIVKSQNKWLSCVTEIREIHNPSSIRIYDYKDGCLHDIIDYFFRKQFIFYRPCSVSDMDCHILPDEHPIYQEIQSYQSVKRDQSEHAFQIYIDLCEVRGWYGLKSHYCNELNCVFLSGKSPSTKSRQIVVPVTTDENCSPRDMQKYFEFLQIDEGEIREITLALCDIDSTLVYYKISNQLVRPEDPQETELKKKKKSELFRNAQTDLAKFVDQYYDEQTTNS